MARTSCFFAVGIALLVSVVGCGNAEKDRLSEKGQRALKLRLINPSSFQFDSASIQLPYDDEPAKAWIAYDCKSTAGAKATIVSVVTFDKNLTVKSIEDEKPEPKDRPITDFIDK